jgi:streptogramin lyase
MCRWLIPLLAASALFAGCGDDSKEPTSTSDATTGESALPEAIPVAGAAEVDLEDRLVKKLKIPEEPDWMVAAFGSVWSLRGNGDVVRIDPESGKVDDTIANPFGFEPPLCQGIGASEDAIWACPAHGRPPGDIIRIDPESNEVVSTLSTRKMPAQGRLVSSAEKLWLITDSGKQLTGVDLRTEKPGAELRLPGVCPQLASQSANEDETLWAVCPAEDKLLRIDPGGGPEVTGEVELAGADNASVGEDVWVAFEGGVAQVDPESLQVLAVYELHARFGGAIHATDDEVWVREAEGHFLARIDPDQQQIVETIEAPDLPSGGDVVVIGDSVWATAYDQSTMVQLTR